MNESCCKMESETQKAEPTHTGPQFTPRVDVHETEQELLFCADMPGVRPEDVHLRYEKGELTLVGKVMPPQTVGTERLHEYEVGDYVRTFAVHESVDSEKISAELKHGVLTVRLAKREETKPREIKIQAG